MSRKIEPRKAKHKAEQFCAYQERSPKEVLDKLRKWGISEDHANDMLALLVEEGFVDEQRFANAFCHDKFEFNSWGKQKIKAEIYTHQLDPKAVDSALSKISEEDYFERILSLAQKKWISLEATETSKRQQKTLAYLTSKGFEQNLIWEAIGILWGESSQTAHLF